MTQPKILDTNIAQSVIEPIGNTPLLQLNRHGRALPFDRVVPL